VDQTTQTIAEFAHGLDPGTFSAAVWHEARRRLVDSLGCLLGAADAPPAVIARQLAALSGGSFAATAAGLPEPTTVELATFANTVMVRYLDFNDTYFGPRGGGGHPSDIVPTALALGQALHLPGPDVLTLVVLGYEVLMRLASTVKLRERGWDQGLYTGVAAAVMTGRALGADIHQLGNAVSLALTPHVPLRVTRAGELSMWKGAATAEAARAGVFAGQLARRGMTGPPRVFDGDDGIFHRVSGEFSVELPVEPERFVIEQVHTKYRPAEYNAQAGLDLAAALHHEHPVDTIARIDVATYWLTWHEIGSEPAKWNPTTRETADHSLPYLLARTLLDGELGLGSFTEEKILDPALRPVMDRITVTEDPELTARFSADLPIRLTVTLTDGTVLVREAAHPRGHVRNPLSDTEFDRKFDDLLAGRSAADRELSHELRDAFWTLDRCADVAPVLARLGELEATR
jgi:2-methylcitrate dehydratase